MSAPAVTAAVEDVLDVLRGVDDPEYPGISIVELGLVADVRAGGQRVEVDLIPTFTGCPALELIAADVREALADSGHEAVDVRFVSSPVWSPDRISPAARSALAATLDVAVAIRSQAPVCPRCGSRSVEQTSMFGATRCRSIARCSECGEHLEVIR